MATPRLLAGRSAVVVGGSRGIDILINCAGIVQPGRSSILNVTSGDFAELLGSHLGTAFQTCRAAAPKMVAQRGGAIVNTSSAAFLGDYGGTGYPAGRQAALAPAPPAYVAPTYTYLASHLAAQVTGQIFSAAGNFVGRYERPRLDPLGYRNHAESPPWTVEAVHEMVRRADSNRTPKARLV